LKVSIKYKGQCTIKETSNKYFVTKCDKCEHCSKKEKPVCGVDGVTYRNACVARCSGLKLKGVGRCEDICVEEKDNLDQEFSAWAERSAASGLDELAELVRQENSKL
jgi:hypothetical protein